MLRLFYNFAYRFTRPRWDTGITPPELVALIETQKLAPGRALDLGCGTGTNVVYLAQHGWNVVGVDFVGKALEQARRKAQNTKVQAEFFQADVTRLDFLQPPFHLVLDMGCFHGLSPERRADYIAGVRRLLEPGGTYLLYAFTRGGLVAGVGVEDVLKLFADGFKNVQVEHGQGMPSAWYTFVRE